MSKLQAGAARADMTPPLGIWLAGYWLPRPAESVDTPLTAHALALDDEAAKLAIGDFAVPGIVAHESAMADGNWRDVPLFDW